MAEEKAKKGIPNIRSTHLIVRGTDAVYTIFGFPLGHLSGLCVYITILFVYFLQLPPSNVFFLRKIFPLVVLDMNLSESWESVEDVMSFVFHHISACYGQIYNHLQAYILTSDHTSIHFCVMKEQHVFD